MGIDDLMNELCDIGLGWAKSGLSQEARYLTPELFRFRDGVDGVNGRSSRDPVALLGGELGSRAPLVDGPDLSSSVVDRMLVIIEGGGARRSLLLGIIVFEGVDDVLNGERSTRLNEISVIPDRSKERRSVLTAIFRDGFDNRS